MNQSDALTIEFGPIEDSKLSGMARGGPVDMNWRLRLLIGGEYVPPMGEFNIDGEYNIALPPYNLLKASANFILSDDGSADYVIGQIDWPKNYAKVEFCRNDPLIDVRLTYRREFCEAVSEQKFAAEILRSGREYLRLAREEVIPAALEHTDLYEPEAEMHHEDLDELETLLDELEAYLDDFDEQDLTDNDR